MDLTIFDWEFQRVAFANWSAFSFSSASVATADLRMCETISEHY